MRIQFDLTPDMLDRLTRYVPSLKMRHHIAYQALDEWLNRREGRDRRLQIEQAEVLGEVLLPAVQHLIDSGQLHMPTSDTSDE